MMKLLPALLLIFCSCSHFQECHDAETRLPIAKNKKIHPQVIAKLETVSESSGLCVSSKRPSLIWTHNDSGHQAQIIAFDLLQKKELSIINLAEQHNLDFEDICIDPKGTIFIANTGNNSNMRQDHQIISFSEPTLNQSTAITCQSYHFRYPDYHFPPKLKNFDCEAIFSFNNKIYLLTKHRSDTCTKLYRIKHLKKQDSQVELIRHVDIHGMVTAADCSPSQKQLAILTYDTIYLFKNYERDNFFDGQIFALNIEADQCEGLTFLNEDEILISNEQKSLFLIPTKDFIQVQ